MPKSDRAPARDVRALVASLCIAATLAVALPVAATTFSIATFGKMTVVRVGSTDRLLAARRDGAALAMRPVTGIATWTTIDLPTYSDILRGHPPVLMFPMTGVVGLSVLPATSTCTNPGCVRHGAPGLSTSRVFSVSQPYSHQANLFQPARHVQAALWELDASTTPPTWTSRGAPASTSTSGLLDNSPALAVAYVPGHTRGSILHGNLQLTPGELWVAARGADLHVRLCHYRPDVPGAQCQWLDATTADSSGPRFAASDVAIINTSTGLRVYAVSPTGILRQFTPDTHGGGTWLDLPAIDDAGPRTITRGGVSALGLGDEIRVAVGAHGTGLDIANRIYLMRSVDGGASWGATRIVVSGDLPGLGFDTELRSSLDQRAFLDPSGHLTAAVFADGLFGEATVPCVLPDLPPPIPGVVSALCQPIEGVAAMPRPSDLMPITGPIPVRDFVGPSIVGFTDDPDPGVPGATHFEVFTTGRLATTGYVYEIESPSDGIRGPIWHSLLAPRDETVPLTRSSNEFQIDEFFGDIVVADSFSCESHRSRDDGNSWTALGRIPSPDVCGDIAIAFEGSGTPYALLGGPATSFGNLQLLRGDVGTDGMTTWMPTAPPSSVPGEVYDRPFLLGDHSAAHRLLLTWSVNATAQGGGAARFAYCTGPDECQTGQAWCGPFRLEPGFEGNLGGGCGGNGAGCQLARTNDGNFWLLFDDDADCPAPTSRDGDLARVFSVRRLITKVDRCETPVWGDAECFYRTIPPPVGASAPPEENSWSVTMSGAGDSPRLALSVRVFRDTRTGEPCTRAASAESPCRSEIVYIERNAEGLWCNPDGTCVDPATTIHQFDPVFSVAHTDPAADGASHQMGAIVALDNGYVGLTWYDFRPIASQPSGAYQVYLRAARFSEPGIVFGERLAWGQVGFWTSSPDSGRRLGDIDVGAAAHLHAHWARRFIPSGCPGCTGAETVIWSPRSPPR